MSRNGSGVQTSPAADYPAVADTLITAAHFNNVIDDINTGLTNSIAVDGQTTITANLPMNSKKFTGLANGSARTDSVTVGQVQDGTLNWVDGGGTADAITATYSPAITALVDGQICCVRATGANTITNPTFAPNGLTARIIYRFGGQALAVGDIRADQHELLLRYDLGNTRWELLNPATSVNSSTVTVADAAADTTTWPLLATSQTGNLGPATDAGLTYNASTNELTATGFLGTATTSNRTDSGEVTVTAHATTGDIFAAAANSVLWDDAGGAITCTIFPNASKAGMTRELRCNGATKFTAGANLSIEGIPSGTTITLISGALVKVRAITVSQFKLTYSLSGTFTATGTGFTANPTTTASYEVSNGWCKLTIPAGALTGTSNATTFTVTGLPTCIVPVSAKYFPIMFAFDNSAASYPTGVTITAGAAVITLSKGAITGGAWTGSGTKTLNVSELIYSLS